MDTKPNVMIAMPSLESIYTAFVVNLQQIQALTQTANVHVGFAIGSVIHTMRNGLARESLGLNSDMDYLFFLDTDIMAPVDVIDRLLAHQKDIVCATYRQRKPPFAILGKQVVLDDRSALREFERVPAGCLMIKTSVFKKIEEPWFDFHFNGSTEISEDYVFSKKARDAGYQIWCDIPTSLELGHLALQPIRTNREYPKGEI